MYFYSVNMRGSWVLLPGFGENLLCILIEPGKMRYEISFCCRNHDCYWISHFEEMEEMEERLKTG